MKLFETFETGAVREDTVDFLLREADRNNALQLKAVCLHLIRNNNITKNYIDGNSNSNGMLKKC